MTKIAIIQGHPDPDEHRFCHALAQAYAKGAEAAGHQIRLINVATIDFPLLRTKADFDHGQIPASIQQAQEIIQWAEHLVLIYPLWLGAMPAYLKGFMEQVFRPGFAAMAAEDGKPWKKLLTGRSARIIITMGMPALIYRWVYFAHSLRSLKRDILAFCGISPIHETLIGMIEAMDDNKSQKWLKDIAQLGNNGA